MIFNSIGKGLAGTLTLLIFYFVVVSLISGVEFSLNQFFANRYWILALAFGFGVQVGLFSYIKARHRAMMSKKMVVVSGAASGTAMVACCAHYLANVVPLISATGLVTLVSQYQGEFFAIGLAFNLLGIGYLVYKLVKHE
mgnify:CR=1 FL=1